jgi:pimeloyl-ACP methyl ester carboxylesterase
MRFGPWRTLATLRYALAHHIERKLPLLRAPALLVRGQHDTICPQPWLEELAALTPGSELLVLPGAPHALNYDQPQALAVAMFDFLARRLHD